MTPQASPEITALKLYMRRRQIVTAQAFGIPLAVMTGFIAWFSAVGAWQGSIMAFAVWFWIALRWAITAGYQVFDAHARIKRLERSLRASAETDGAPS